MVCIHAALDTGSFFFALDTFVIIFADLWLSLLTFFYVIYKVSLKFCF